MEELSVFIFLTIVGIAVVFLPFFPRKVFYLTLLLFFASPGRIFREPFSNIYYIQGIWLILFSPVDILLSILGFYSLILAFQKVDHLILHEDIALYILLSLYILTGILRFGFSEPPLLLYTLISVLRILEIYLLINVFVRDMTHIENCLIYITIGLSIQSIYSLITFNKLITEITFMGRLGAPGLSVNSVGAIGALIIPIIIMCILFCATNKLQRGIFVIGLLSIFLNFLFSLSRAGILGLLLGLIFFFFKLKGRVRLKIAKFVIFFVIVLGVILSNIDLPTISRIYVFSFTDLNAISRLQIWKDTILKMFSSPSGLLLGVGMFGNRLLLGSSLPSQYDHAHNFFIQLFLETGLIGVFLFIFILVYIFKALLKIMKIQYDNKFRWFSLGFVSGLLGFFTASFLDYTLWEQKVFLLFWTILLLTMRYIRIFKNRIGRSVR